MSNAPQRADAVVCGAGVAGIGAAYFLSLHDDFKRIVIIDERPPLTLTSDKSTECYRNWWPGPGPEMVTFMDRSIDLLEEFSDRTNNRIGLNRRGYLFASADPNNREAFVDESLARSALGIGETRVHSNSAHRYPPAHMTNVDKSLRGADVFTNAALIQEQFPYLPADTQAVIHARRCGWLSAQQLGMLMLEEAKERGVEVVMASLKGIETQTGAVSAVRLESAQGEHEITTSTVINAAGPMFRAVGAMANVDIPVTCEGHVKIAFADTKNAMARETPLLIWVDPVELGWTADQRNDLAADPELKYLTQQFPAGVHGRPEGSGKQILLYWTYHCEASEPTYPLQWDEHYPEITIRGMTSAVPGLRQYFDELPRPYVDGGYYTKTRENRPLIGPTNVSGMFLCGAYSGYGIMASSAGGELLAKHVTGAALPSYAPAFLLARYSDPEYVALLADWPDAGQL